MLIDMTKQLKPGRVYRLHVSPDRWTVPMLCNSVKDHSEYTRSYLMTHKEKGSFHDVGCYYWQHRVIGTGNYDRIIEWKLCWFRSILHSIKRHFLSRKVVKSIVRWFQTKRRNL